MQILVLGTRGEIPESLPYHSKQSGVLVNQELLIDFGEKEFLKYQPKWILITHFHPDHAYFVRRGKEEIPPENVPIYAPEIFEALQHRVQIIDAPTMIGPYAITPIPTHHSKHVKSQAYLIEKDKKALLYTGDLVWIDKKYHPLIGHVDLIITEASFLRKGGMIRRDPETGEIFGHNGVPNLISLLKPFSKKFLFVHFGSWFYKNTKESRQKLLSLEKEANVEIIIGYDGLSLNLEKLSV